MPGTVILFEDHFLDDMRPVTLTRPAFGVTCGIYNLHQIARRTADRVGYVVREYLARIAEREFGPADAPHDGPTLFLNASLAPDARCVKLLRAALAEGQPFLCTSGQRVAAALLRCGERVPQNLTSTSVTPYLLNLNLPLHEEELLRTVDFPFHLVRELYKVFLANVQAKIAEGQYTEARPGVFLGKGVTLPETAVFHPDNGPIVLDDGVKALDFTYFTGPVYVGPGSRIIERSSVKEFTCAGHTCKIGGEIEASIIEPYSNKQHHGFLGHAYVGSWVNMGAGTSNSDLKNTYGEVRVEIGNRRVDTGMQFLGCIIGDFSKTAINTSIFTGKIIGVGSMLYGYVGQNVPSFCNYARSFGQVTEVPVEAAARTQQRMFSRRNVEQTPDDVALLQTVFDLTREERLMSSELPVL